MDILFKKCFLDNSKFSLISEYLGIGGVIAKRVHCNWHFFINFIAMCIWLKLHFADEYLLPFLAFGFTSFYIFS